MFPDLGRGGIEFYRLEVYMILGAFFKEKNTKIFYFCKFYKAIDLFCSLNKFYKAIDPCLPLERQN